MRGDGGGETKIRPFSRFASVALALFLGTILGASAAVAEKKTLFVGMASADAGKLDPHLTATTPDKGFRTD
jgi:hypothetical protein